MPELTPEEIIRNTIAAANRTTSATDTDLTTAVKRLRDGYGGSSASLSITTTQSNAVMPQGSYDGIETITFTNANNSNSSVFKYVTGIKKIVFDVANQTTGLSLFQSQANDTYLEEITLLNSTSRFTNFQATFANRAGLKRIIGEIDMSGSANNYTTFAGCVSLEEVRFVKNSITMAGASISGGNPSFMWLNSLSDDSLTSLANGLKPYTAADGAKITMPKNMYDYKLSMLGNVVDGVFTKSSSGSVTLLEFIVNTKVWTVIRGYA